MHFSVCVCVCASVPCVSCKFVPVAVGLLYQSVAHFVCALSSSFRPSLSSGLVLSD